MGKNKGGRPTVMTPEVIGKLEMAYALDCTDAEACLMANIHPSSLYDYLIKYPEFSERRAQLKNTPFLKARQAIVDGFEDDPNLALKYMERKKKDEFSPKKTIEHEFDERAFLENIKEPKADE